MPFALWLLLYLRIKGGIRRALFSGSAKKTITTVIGAVCMFFWVVNFALRGLTTKQSASPETMQLIGPVVMVVLTLVPLAVGGAGRMLAFTPIEIDQLFTAPFSRRQLVVYRLIKMSFKSMFTGLFYALIFRGNAGTWLGAFAAGCLVWMFGSFLTLTFALLESLAGARVRALRFIPQLLLIVTLVLPAWNAYQFSHGGTVTERMHSIVGAPALQAIGLPFKPFVMLFTAATLSDIAFWGSISVAVTLITALAAVRLDAAWLDVSVQATHARAQRIERKAKGNVRGPGPISARLKRFVPELLFAGPARAIIRRHLMAAPSVFVVPVVVPIVIGSAIYFVSGKMPGGAPDVVKVMLPIIFMVLLFVIPAAARQDFRSDLEHFEVLKTLPLGTVALTAAQLATPTTLLIVLALELAAIFTIFDGARPVTLGIALCIPPAGVLLIALENALFLFVPTRASTQQVAALQVTGKRAIMIFAKLIAIGVCGGLAALVIMAVMAICDSIFIACAAAAVLLTVEAVIAVVAVGKLFAGFDVAVDMPD